MMQQECMVRGTPAQLAGLIQRAFVTLQEDGRQVPILRLIDSYPYQIADHDGVHGVTVMGPAPDALTARLQIDNREGEPPERYAMLLFEQEAGDVTRLHLNIEPAGWSVFGRMFWDDLRDELKRRGLLVDAARRPGPNTSNEQKLKIWEGWEHARRRGTSQQVYCDGLAALRITPRTLRNWRDDLRREGVIS